jgi:phosphonate metabolism-associated iron-containing alcohol dehydrogenase
VTESGIAGFQWRMPVDVRFGAGCVSELNGRLGDRSAVVMAFEPATALGWRAQWTSDLGQRLRAWVEVPDGLSSMARCREFAEQVWPVLVAEPDTVLIALGGGTTLDIAKVLRCRPVEADPRIDQLADERRRTHPAGFDAVADALRGKAPWPALDLAPLWMVPTTAGTGSEVTRWATVWDTDVDPAQKRSFDEAFGFADCAFVDPALTHSCPAAVTRDTGLDALSHALEAIWNRHANPFSDVLAVSAARKVLTWLPVALREPANVEARSALSLASLEAGFAFSQTRTALAHALSYAVTLEQGTPHGLACAMWLPTAWELAQGCSARVDGVLEQVFVAEAGELVEPRIAGSHLGAHRLQAWLSSVGVSCDPAKHGVLDAERRIHAALSSPRGRNFIAA